MSRAVVLGGGFAGVLAALVLAEHGDDVIRLDSAESQSGACPRPGLPQGHHSHVLVSGGARALDELLPGTTAALLAAGAQRYGLPDGALILSSDGWFQRHETGADLISCSRWLMDQVIRQRALSGGTVSARESTVVVGLVGNASQVSGVTVRTAGGDLETIRADVVLDATGRRSRAPQWLLELGGPSVEEERVDSGLAYSTRLYRAPADLATAIPVVMIHPRAEPGQPGQGGTLYPIEGGRWIVTLTGTSGGQPPADERGFERFARALRSPVIAELMASATPLGAVRPYRNTSNRRRYFERASLPNGFLVIGDALVAVNPIHSHGMSVAALSALRLRGELERAASDVSAVAGLQTVIANEADRSWQMATRQDARYVEGEAGPRDATPFERRTRSGMSRKLLSSQALMADVFRRQTLIAPDTGLGETLFREMATGPERLLTDDEAVAQYPGLSQWWFSEHRRGAGLAI